MHIDIHALSGFEPMIPVFERAKTVHAFYRSATVIASTLPHLFIILHLVKHKDNVSLYLHKRPTAVYLHE
jgi:hypothetical protein